MRGRHLLKVLHYVNEGNLAWVQPWMQLLDALRTKGICNVVMCPEYGTLASIAREHNFEVRTCKAPFPWAPALCLEVGKTVKSVKPDLIHTRLSSAAALGGYWGYKLGIPVVATLDKYPKTKYYTHVTHLVGCSRAVSKHMIDQGIPEKKVSTIHNPVLFERYIRNEEKRLELREKAGIEEGQIVVLGAGRFVKWKAFDVLIKAAAKIESSKNWVLWLVGDGSERKHLERLVEEYCLQDRTTFWGFASDVRPHLWASDIFVQPSGGPEGFSLMLLEAMASGLPAIATNIGGTLDILEEGSNGWFVKPGDVDGLCRVLSFALDQADLTEVGLRASQSAARFRVEPIACQHEDLYRFLVQNKTELGK